MSVARIEGASHLRAVSGTFREAYEGIEETGYDPDGFYVRAVNKHDHRVDTRVPMNPETKQAIDHLIASGDLLGTPIKSYHAFMRDAAVHNLHRLARVSGSPRIAEVAARQRMVAEAETMRTELGELKAFVEHADESLDYATKAGDVEAVAEFVTMYEGAIGGLRDPYAGQLEVSLADARRWLRAHRAAAEVE